MAQTQNLETISPAVAGGKQEKKALAHARDALLEARFTREATGRHVDCMLRHVLVGAKGMGGITG